MHFKRRRTYDSSQLNRDVSVFDDDLILRRENLLSKRRPPYAGTSLHDLRSRHQPTEDAARKQLSCHHRRDAHVDREAASNVRNQESVQPISPVFRWRSAECRWVGSPLASKARLRASRNDDRRPCEGPSRSRTRAWTIDRCGHRRRIVAKTVAIHGP